MAKTEIIYGQVVSKANNYQVAESGGRRHIIKSSALREYEKSFLKQCKIYRDRNINRRFKLAITVYESSARYDLDNSIKTVLDCLQYARAISDDKLCVSIDAEKRIDAWNPRVEYSIIEYEPELF